MAIDGASAARQVLFCLLFLISRLQTSAPPAVFSKILTEQQQAAHLLRTEPALPFA